MKEDWYIYFLMMVLIIVAGTIFGSWNEWHSHHPW
jgi:hypothetical protein